ncbi:MAG: AcrB/AcrD/AcrF family protein [Sphingomicrobium sp.]
MDQRKDHMATERPVSEIQRLFEKGEAYIRWAILHRWRWLVVAAWLILATLFLVQKWRFIGAFGLADTDDNMRMMQVRALLHGQGWFDLRQYRLNPPFGANIHWSRLVDLPIAGIIITLRPFAGGAFAEKTAVAVAPLLPMLLMLFSLSVVVRRLVHPLAYLLLFVSIYFAGSTSNMFMPLRIDHHGWQLALLALGMSGIADPKRARGGAVLGIASALSLAIGLEMLIYLAVAAAAMVLFWVADANERVRLQTYALALAGGTALSFVLFVSYANRAAVCDALSPVWLSDALVGGALTYGLARWSPSDWRVRLAAAAVAGALVAGFHAFAWPQCLQRLEGVSPEVEKLWLSHVREARPVWKYEWRTLLTVVVLPVTGLIGWAALAWVRRREPDALRRVLAIAIPALAAVLLLGWQTRTGPAAQMFGAAGAAALVGVLLPWVLRRVSWMQPIILLPMLLIGLGAAVPLTLSFVPAKQATARSKAIGRANALCNYMPSYRPLAAQPKGLVFTFVDLGPRVITVTHHNAVAGPYHRNGQQIADVMRAFRGNETQAHAIISDKYHADYLLICPNSSTTTIFAAEAPKGFYTMLAKGEEMAWLEPIRVPANSPFRLWKVAPSPALESSASTRR